MISKINLKRRDAIIIKKLLEAELPLTSKDLSEELNVSVRTIKSDLQRVEQFLSAHDIKLIRKPKVGIYVLADSKEKEKLLEEINFYLPNLRKFSREERIKQIILDFFISPYPITIEFLCEKFSCSRPTIIRDLKVVKSWFDERSIKLVGKPGVGLFINGQEVNIRKTLVSFLLSNKFDLSIAKHIVSSNNSLSRVQRLNEFIKFFGFFDFEGIKKLIETIEKEIDIRLVDSSFVALATHIAIAIKRIKRGKRILMDKKQLGKISSTKEFDIVKSNKKILEDYYNIEIPEEEVGYITLHLLGARLRVDNNLSIFPSRKNYERIAEDFVHKLLRKVQDDLLFPIKGDKKLLLGLINHLSASIVRLQYGLDIENPFLEKIKLDHPLLFSLIRNFIKELEKSLNIKIPDSEIGFITMHIIAAIERLQAKISKLRRVVVVCPTGLGTSELLASRLKAYFPDLKIVKVASTRDIIENRLEGEVDLIISTVSLPLTNIPYVKVSPFLNKKEVEQLSKLLNVRRKGNCKFYGIGGKLEMDESLLDERLIILNLKAKNREEVIEQLSEKLLKYGYVKEGFTKAILEREERFPTGLPTPIPTALPHVDAKYANKPVIAISTLREPVDFREMGNPQNLLSVEIVFLIVLKNPKKQAEVLKKLVQEFQNVTFLEKVKASSSTKEVKELLLRIFD